MKTRYALLAAAAVMSLPALADSGVTLVAGEIGFIVHDMPSTRSRADVLRELAAPPATNGWRRVHGEAGWEYVDGPSTVTRAAVIAEAILANRNRAATDGWFVVAGELGAVYVGTPSGEAQRVATRPRNSSGTNLGLLQPASASTRP